MKKIILIFIIFSLILPMIAFAQANIGGGGGFSLVPCGTSTTKARCDFKDIILLIVRVINLMLVASAVVAMYYTLLSGWGMMTSLGNPEKIMAAKTGFEKALVGFAIVLLSFAFINLLVQGIFGLENCKWWLNPTDLWSESNCIIPRTGA